MVARKGAAMWIFDGEQWDQDHDSGSRTPTEGWARQEVPVNHVPELRVIEIPRVDPEERLRAILPFIVP